jgi:hypothetical protein
MIFLRATIYSYLLTKTVLIGVVSIDTFYKCFIDSSWILTLKQISPRGEHPGYKNRTQCCASGGVQYLPQRERNTRDIKIGHSFSAMGGVQNLTQRESPENKIGSSFSAAGGVPPLRKGHSLVVRGESNIQIVPWSMVNVRCP